MTKTHTHHVARQHQRLKRAKTHTLQQPREISRHFENPPAPQERAHHDSRAFALGGGGGRGGGLLQLLSPLPAHLNRREGHQALGEAGELRVTPSKRPPCLSAHARHGLHRVEKVSLLCWVFHVSVDKQAVHLAVYVFDRDLEAVEATGLRELDLAAEVARQVLFFFCGGGEQEGEGKEFFFKIGWDNWTGTT